jgi:hypothetical protein
MRLWTSIVVLGTMVGCQEYNLSDGNPVTGSANPPPLEQPVNVDRIVQVTERAVDVLWVIDNSCSMLEEQTGISANFESFINYFVGSGLDWHLGVVSTDMDDPQHSGRLRQAGGYKFLTEDTVDPVNLFGTMVNMGTNGSGTEKGRAAAYAGIGELSDTHNADFYREDASLSVIVISDEEDQSKNNPVSLEEFKSWLTNLKSNVDMVNFSSIVCLSDSDVGGVPCRHEDNAGAFWANPTIGSEYVEVTDTVGGVLWDIRDSNWTQVLEELGMQAAGLKREFFLADIPVPQTISVWVQEPAEDGGEIFYFDMGQDYDYSPTRNSIKFHTFVPTPLSEVFIEYELLSAVVVGPAESEDGADTGS